MVEQKWEFDKNSEHYHKQKSGRQHRDSTLTTHILNDYFTRERL